MPTQAPSDFKRKVTFAGSDKDACSSMGLHQIDEDSDVDKPKSTNPSEKQMKKLEADSSSKHG